MRKFTIGVVIVLVAVFGFARPAAADGQGTCSLVGGLVKMNVKETPNEGSVKYVSIASPVQLDVGAGGSEVHTYYESDGAWGQGKYIYSSPVDGDGYWNYRADFNWDSQNITLFRIGYVFFNIQKYGSTNYCTDSVHI